MWPSGILSSAGAAAEERRLANSEHLAILEQGAVAWNLWRKENAEIVPDLNGADRRGKRLIAGCVSDE